MTLKARIAPMESTTHYAAVVFIRRYVRTQIKDRFVFFLFRVGSATNEIYRKDGRRVEMHPTEDRLFHFSVEEFGVSLYGVCDGFGGNGVADFAAKKMPAELLLGQVQFKIALLVISMGFE